MAQRKICSKLNELQEVLLNDKDFLKRAVESFCQKLLEEEITQFLQADKYLSTREQKKDVAIATDTNRGS